MPADEQFLPLQYPIAYQLPKRITQFSAWVEHVPFAMVLVELLKPKVIVELGTHWGDSYCAFCQAVAHLRLQTRCFAVDTWRGDSQTGPYEQDVLSDLRAHHDPIYGTFSTLMQADFDSASKHFEDGSIDLLHIDGLHTYEAVCHDFETWRAKLSPSAVVLFHDTAVRVGDFGVWKLWSELITRYPHFEFTHCSGLGVLRVGSSIPPAIDALFRAEENNAAQIRQFYRAVGQRAGLYRLTRQLIDHMFTAQSRINLWKQSQNFELSIGSDDAEIARKYPTDFAHNLLREIDHLISRAARTE